MPWAQKLSHFLQLYELSLLRKALLWTTETTIISMLQLFGLVSVFHGMYQQPDQKIKAINSSRAFLKAYLFKLAKNDKVKLSQIPSLKNIYMLPNNLKNITLLVRALWKSLFKAELKQTNEEAVHRLYESTVLIIKLHTISQR